MDILETTVHQFNRASERVDAKRGRPISRGHPDKARQAMQTLSERWSVAREFKRWKFMFDRLGLPEAMASTVFSIGIEIGYELRVAQEEDRADA